MKPDYQRQMSFYSPNSAHKVLVIGAGSIGSYIVFGLARMGVKNITVVDFDNVENHNLPNQFFSEQQLPEQNGTLLKVIALESSLRQFMPDTMASVKLRVVAKPIEECINEINDVEYTAIFTAVDKMDVRKYVWNQIQNRNLRTKYLIDPRVGGLYANIFSLSWDSLSAMQVYEKNLWDDSEIEELPCTARSIIDTTFTVAGECISRFRQAVAGKLSVIWTFHDYAHGSSSIMAHYQIKDDGVKRDNEFVKTLNEV